MRKLDFQILKLIPRLRSSESGIAYLEFALVLPFIMLLFLGGVEMTRYLQASMKVDKLTHTIVDLVAQSPTISVPEMDRIMVATDHIMDPMDFATDGTMIITCVGYNDRGQRVVKWQYKGGGALDRDSLIGEQGETPVLPQGFSMEQRDNVIIAESFFRLDPMINNAYADQIEFYRTAFYLPRLGELDQLRAS